MNKKEDVKKLTETEGFFKHNNYELVEVTAENCTLKAQITENALNPYGIAHGGFIFGLGDTSLGIIAALNGRPAVTLNSTINFLKAAKTKYIIAKGEILKRGKKITYLQAKIYDDQDNLIALMDANYYYID